MKFQNFVCWSSKYHPRILLSDLEHVSKLIKALAFLQCLQPLSLKLMSTFAWSAYVCGFVLFCLCFGVV